MPVLTDFEGVRDATLCARNNHGAGATGHYMERRADTPTTHGFIGQNGSPKPNTANSNSGIPAWRVCNVRRMLVASDE
ncbi:MAG TPA: hypothetical protein ENH62_12860 [Marinobacter sp.]|uniref:Uncharacterized protein n=1 Tax=Marinobacter antarcticus TaxID=564117 RepID=A0A831W321_9GAMM|nr:hypothetical protein [Marinobacter sp.]HEA53927.1 hypothetical protein [Marinobacter antarcticus]